LSNDDSNNDPAQSTFRKDNGRGGIGGVSCTLHSNTNVGMPQRWGVVNINTISCGTLKKEELETAVQTDFGTSK
jgi:hypothetical protein